MIHEKHPIQCLAHCGSLDSHSASSRFVSNPQTGRPDHENDVAMIDKIIESLDWKEFGKFFPSLLIATLNLSALLVNPVFLPCLNKFRVNKLFILLFMSA